MTNAVALTIVIPFYNAGMTLGRMLESLKRMMPAPSFRFEVLIIDDGSTEEVPSSLLLDLPFDCTVYRKENGGPLSARCYGIEHAKADYVYFADADDALRDTFFKDFCDVLKAGDFDICLVDFYDKAGKKSIETSYPPLIDEKYYVRNLVGTAKLGYAITHIFNKALFTPDVKRKVEQVNIRYSEDLYFWILLYRPNRVYRRLANPAYIYLPGAGSLSSRLHVRAIKDIVEVMEARYSLVKEIGQSVSYSEEVFFCDVVHLIAYVRIFIFRHTPRKEKKDALSALLSVSFIALVLGQKRPNLTLVERFALWKLGGECKRARAVKRRD